MTNTGVLNQSVGRTDLSSSSDLQQSLQQQVKRLAARAANQQFVGAWNAQNSNQLGYKLAVNRFVDWLPEEYSSLMTAKRSTARSEQIKVHGVDSTVSFDDRVLFGNHIGLCCGDSFVRRYQLKLADGLNVCSPAVAYRMSRSACLSVSFAYTTTVRGFSIHMHQQCTL